MLVPLLLGWTNSKEGLQASALPLKGQTSCETLPELLVGVGVTKGTHKSGESHVETAGLLRCVPVVFFVCFCFQLGFEGKGVRKV